MPLITTPLAHLLIILIIGIVAGIVVRRGGTSWLGRHIGTGTHTDVTTALVGIAGAFIGFHVGIVLELLPSPVMLYLLAAVGAVATLWLWRGR